MPRNKQKFKKDLADALKDAQLESFKASFGVSLDENESAASMQLKIANATADKFSEVVSAKLPKIFDDYIDSLEFDVTGLANSGGPVSGILKIK